MCAQHGDCDLMPVGCDDGKRRSGVGDARRREPGRAAEARCVRGVPHTWARLWALAAQ